MFDNVGGKIKGVISTFFAIMTVLSIICGILVMITVSDLSVFLGLLAGGATAGLGILFTWLMSLVGYAFGQLVENSDIIRAKLENTNSNYTDVAPIAPTTTFESTESGTTKSSSSTPKTSSVIYENTSYITCPNCKESQPAGKTYCTICGAKMVTAKPSISRDEMYDVLNKKKESSKDESVLVCCPKCGKLQHKGKNYCEVCGEKIPSVLF